MRCLNCKEDILAADVNICPYCCSRRVVSNMQYSQLAVEEAEKLVQAGRFEEAASIYDELEMLDKAGECRRLARTNYVVSASVNIGKVATISMECPHCSASQPIGSKSNEVTCQYCGKNYIIPKRILELL